ncbi:hypothetical protein [Alteromonas sp. 14N.309.X.WAT.G.H12]|uniref:secretion/conjugation apparatus DotM-related subunit n=1 Tax=Alteromonas sp. 14N.309.X.WAT.G.H12 TaxID=3120824 RepID=UPI002FD6CDC0
MDSEGGKRAEFELFVLAIGFGLACVFCFIYFYQYPWYYFNLYTYKVLAIIPVEYSGYVFFWADEAKLISVIHNHLVLHHDDYATYYVSGVGLDRQEDINTVTISLLWPIPALILCLVSYKEIHRKTSPIPLPGRRSKLALWLAGNKGSVLSSYTSSQKEVWPYIKPVVNIMDKMINDPDLDSGWYALAKLPLTWIREHNLTQKIVTKKVRKIFTRAQKSQFTLVRDRAFPVLKQNVGPLWTGLDSLDMNFRCILAVLVPHIFGQVRTSRLMNRKLLDYYEVNGDMKRKKKEALWNSIEKDVNDILNTYKDAFETPYFVDTEFEDPYDPLVSSFEELDSEKDMYEKGKRLVRDALLTHAYEKTVLFSLLERSWTFGILASAEMKWVKIIDRELWYVLSQCGRTSSFVEVVGCWDHFQTEKENGFRTLMPQVKEAFRGLDYDLYRTHESYVPHERYEDSARWDKIVPTLSDSKKAGGLSANAGRSV